MPHPFRRYKNLTLFIDQGTGVFVEDTLTGNMVEERTTETVKASVYKGFYQNRDILQQGFENLYLVGWLVKPRKVALWQHKGIPINATLYDPLTKTTQPGEFIIEAVVQSRFRQVGRTLGNSISGYFKAFE